jgi:NTP-dependent ternary system trypsin peptidase co-occuring protein
MRSAIRFAGAILVLSSLGCVSTTSQTETSAQASAKDGAELAGVMTSIREAIVEAQTHEVAGFPPLKSIVLKLQTTVSRSVGGEVRYLVFSLDSSAGQETGSTLELVMQPPPSRTGEALLPDSLKQALAKAIRLAEIGVLEAAKGDLPLVMKKIDIDLKFALKVDGSAGAGVKLLPLGLDAAGHVSKEKVHTVILSFGQ